MAMAPSSSPSSTVSSPKNPRRRKSRDSDTGTTGATDATTPPAAATGRKTKAKSGAAGRTPRIRSFGGCFTCRARKVKCDERHPLCRQCERSGLECAGYEAKIRFILHGKNGVVLGDQVAGDGGHGRRMLFSEAERQRMSDELKRAVSLDDIDHVLSTIGTDGNGPLNCPNVGSETVGPFTVFHACDVYYQEHHHHHAPPQVVYVGDEHREQARRQLSHHHFIPVQLETPSPPTQEFEASVAETGLNTVEETLLADLSQALTQSPKLDMVNAETTDYNWHDSGMNLQNLQFISMDPAPPPPQPEPVQEQIPPSLSIDSMFRLPALPSLNPPLSAAHYTTSPSLGSSIQLHSHFLLDHYKSQMDKLFSPMRARKPPWSILHFPRALTALSELAICKTLNHAHMSLLYAVLAVSAFNWDNMHQEDKVDAGYWKQVGENFRLGAKKELELAGEREMVGEKSAKYKDILMAILTMVTISVVSGQHDEARSFIINAELFICVRGLQKPRKSRKVKLLHCIYLYLRVIEESTYAYPTERQPASTLSVPLKHMLFPSLRTNSLCVGRDIDQRGDNFEHGLFGSTDMPDADADSRFFVEIYGIPHEMLSLISRATFLANEINMLRRRDPNAPMTFDLSSACRTLEDTLCNWKYTGITLEGDADDPLGSFATQAIMPHLVKAFHSATLIYFLRRVREIHPFVLQHLVEETIVALDAFEQEQRNFSTANCSVAWPGFIAGAEAMDEGLQMRYVNRLKQDAQTSGMGNFSTSVNVLERFWKYKKEKNLPTYQWIDFVRSERLSLVLT